MSSEKKVSNVCPYDCPDACGLLLTLKNSQLVDCSGNANHPYTNGVVCRKMKSYGDFVHSKERILHPLRRIGVKGKGEFKQISWAEALREIGQRWKAIIQNYGPESILPYSYAGTMGLIQRNAGDAFFHKMGASLLTRTICSSSADAGWQTILGTTPGTEPSKAAESDLILLWGIDAAASNLHFMRYVVEASKKGARVIGINVFHNRTTPHCDEMVLIKPHTDGALALGLMHILVRENKVDFDFIKENVLGYDQLLNKVLPRFSPEQTSLITGLTVDAINELAQSIGSAKKAFFRIGIGCSRNFHGAQMIRTILALPALTGTYDNGGVLLMSGTGVAFDTSLVTRPDFLANSSVSKINMNQLGSALTDDERKIKSLFIHSSNPAAVAPNQRAVHRGLAREDLFTVVHERFMTDTARYADIILPATFSPEHDDFYRSYGHFYCQFSPKVMEAAGEAKSNWQTIQLLAEIMGYDHEHFKLTERELIQKLLQHASHQRPELSWENISKGEPVYINIPRTNDDGKLLFATPSGKIELYSESAIQKGLPELPDYLEPQAEYEADLRKNRTFQLITTPALFGLNSTFLNQEELLQKDGGPRVILNKDDAFDYGLQEGQIIELHNQWGSCCLPVQLAEGVVSGVIVAPGVWWPQDCPDGANINAVIGEHLTDLGEGSTFNAYSVQIRPK